MIEEIKGQYIPSVNTYTNNKGNEQAKTIKVKKNKSLLLYCAILALGQCHHPSILNSALGWRVAVEPY